MDTGNTAYSSEGGVLFDKAKTALIQYPIGNVRTSYTIPDSVTSIGSRAFYGCTSLASMIIPDSVTSIGYYAFDNCTQLISLSIPISLNAASSFYGCTNIESVVFTPGTGTG